MRHFSALGLARGGHSAPRWTAGRARSHAPLPVAGERARAREHRGAARHSARGRGGDGDGRGRGARDRSQRRPRAQCRTCRDTDKPLGDALDDFERVLITQALDGVERQRRRGGAAAAHGPPESVSAHAPALDRVERRMRRAPRGARGSLRRALLAGASLAARARAQAQAHDAAADRRTRSGVAFLRRCVGDRVSLQQRRRAAEYGADDGRRRRLRDR